MLSFNEKNTMEWTEWGKRGSFHLNSAHNNREKAQILFEQKHAFHSSLLSSLHLSFVQLKLVFFPLHLILIGTFLFFSVTSVLVLLCAVSEERQVKYNVMRALFTQHKKHKEEKWDRLVGLVGYFLCFCSLSFAPFSLPSFSSFTQSIEKERNTKEKHRK